MNILLPICTLFILHLNLLFAYTVKDIRFKKGETLVYDITAFDIKVAEQRTIIKDITLFSNHEAYLIHTKIKTIPMIDKLYHSQTIIESYIDTQTLLPLYTHTKTEQKKWKNEIEIFFDQENKKALYKDKKREFTITFEEHLFGLDSLIFFIRSLEPTPNEKISFLVHNQRKVQKINTLAHYKSKKEYIPPLKKRVKLIQFITQNEDNAEIWITRDELKIPYKFVSIRLPLYKYGYISIINTLKYYKNKE